MCNASYIYMCVCVSFSVMSNFVSPWTVVPKLLCSWKSPGKNTGVGKPFPSPGDLPSPGLEPRSLALQADSVCSSANWE